MYFSPSFIILNCYTFTQLRILPNNTSNHNNYFMLTALAWTRQLQHCRQKAISCTKSYNEMRPQIHLSLSFHHVSYHPYTDQFNNASGTISLPLFPLSLCLVCDMFYVLSVCLGQHTLVQCEQFGMGRVSADCVCLCEHFRHCQMGFQLKLQLFYSVCQHGFMLFKRQKKKS